MNNENCNLIHPNGVKEKRSGYFDMGEPVGEWITYDSKGKKHKSTNRDKG